MNGFEAKASLNRTKDGERDCKGAENIKKENSETEGRLKVKERKELIRLNYTNTMGTAGNFADETEAIKNQNVLLN